MKVEKMISYASNIFKMTSRSNFSLIAIRHKNVKEITGYILKGTYQGTVIQHSYTKVIKNLICSCSFNIIYIQMIDWLSTTSYLQKSVNQKLQPKWWSHTYIFIHFHSVVLDVLVR